MADSTVPVWKCGQCGAEIPTGTASFWSPDGVRCQRCATGPVGEVAAELVKLRSRLALAEAALEAADLMRYAVAIGNRTGAAINHFHDKYRAFRESK